MSAIALKLEFNPGLTGWVDVTSWAQRSVFSIHVGRGDQYSDAGIATLTGVELDNQDGRFTPQCALLLDGTTANPYYPNLLPRTLIRLSFTVSAVTYYLFYGYVQGWPPMMRNGDNPYVPVQAYDRGKILDGIVVQSGPIQIGLVDGAVGLVPFNDSSGATSWAEVITGANATQQPDSGGATPTVVTSGVANPVRFSDGQTGISINRDQTSAYVRTARIAVPSGLELHGTFETWMTTTQEATTGEFSFAEANLYGFNTSELPLFRIYFGPHPSGGSGVAGTCGVDFTYADGTQTLSIATSTSLQLTDSLAHHGSVTWVDNGTNLTLTLYVDGVNVGSVTGTSGVMNMGGYATMNINGGADGTTITQTSIFGPTAFYNSTLSAALVAQHYYAGAGGAGQTTSQRVAEYLRWVPVAGADQALDTGIQIVGTHAVAGKSILTLCQDMATTEGGGSVFYHDMNGGKSTFLNRNFRNGSTPLITFDAEADNDGPSYGSAYDADTLANQSTVTREGGTAQTYTDTASITAYGLATDSATSYANTDGAALNLAQDRVASRRAPAFRLPQMVIDVLTATTAGLPALLGVLKIGSRARQSNLVAAQTGPRTTADVFVEGWTLTIGADVFTIAIDTSPADNPFRGGFDTVRYAPTRGDLLLSTAINNSTTTVILKWTDGPKVTTTSGSYPLYIQIDEEIIQLVGVPGGSTSPQTFTSCVRGALGTRAATHSVNAVVSLYPNYKNQL